jgi:hypothetical protein
MISNTDKGFEVRDYFIDCEERYREGRLGAQAPTAPLAAPQSAPRAALWPPPVDLMDVIDGALEGGVTGRNPWTGEAIPDAHRLATRLPHSVATPSSSLAPNLHADLPRVFEFEGRPIRVILEDERPWFVVRDLVEALDFFGGTGGAGRYMGGVPSNCRRTQRLQTPGGKQRMLLISEVGLRPFLDSKLKPNVPRFRQWLTDTVLPALHGAADAGDPRR